MSTPPLIRRRTIILTIGAVAITAVGAYTGAQLKSDLQAQRQKEISGEAGIDGRIRRYVYIFSLFIYFPGGANFGGGGFWLFCRLVEYRDGLERRRVELEGKIRGLEGGDGE